MNNVIMSIAASVLASGLVGVGGYTYSIGDRLTATETVQLAQVDANKELKSDVKDIRSKTQSMEVEQRGMVAGQGELLRRQERMEKVLERIEESL